MPLNVSATVTTLNEEQYIEECLESVFNQTVSPDEVILIDAGSEDDTLKIAGEYPVDIYSVDFHDVFLSKHAGMTLSSNPFVLCVDGDSAVSRNFVEKSLDLIEGNDAVSGKIIPHNSNFLSNFISRIQNNNPAYLSGPAFLIDKESYFKFREMNGYYDEIPLQAFDTVESDDIFVRTELPSDSQKALVTVAGGVGLSLLVADKYL